MLGRSAFHWAADKILTVLFGAEEEVPDYPPTVVETTHGRMVARKCPCDCGMVLGEVWEAER